MKCLWAACVLWVSQCVSVGLAEEAGSPVVDSPTNGAVRGVRVSSRMGRTIDAFLGVPFAQPPVGDLRMRRPRPLTRGSGVYEATKAKPGCLQLDFGYGDLVHIDNSDTSEDCLYLNIFVPRKSDSAEEYEEDDEAGRKQQQTSQKLPVFVYLYGGAFLWGENQLALYDGVEFSAGTDAIFVAVNYRLNLFGFLNSSTPGMPGNMGLWDQFVALQWVQSNIAAFGGDPQEVTLGGQSAGAMSAAMFSYLPMARGLMKRVLLMSGTSVSTRFLQQTIPDSLFQEVAFALDCYEIDPEKTAECIRQKTISRREMQEIEKTLNSKWFNFGPYPGDELLPYPTGELYRNEYHVSDIMIGVNQREGDFMSSAFQQWLPALGESMKDMPETVIRLMMKTMFGIRIADTGHIFRAYLRPADEEALTSERAARISSEVIGDGIFNCPTQFFAANAASRGVRVRHYVYAHSPSVRFNLNLGLEPTHSDDIPFMLGAVNARAETMRMYGMKTPTFFTDVQKKFTPEEHHFSRVVIEQIGNFVWSGKPRIPGSDKEWPLYTADDPQIVYMAPNNFTIVRGLKSDKCDLWEPYLLDKPEEKVSTTAAPAVEKANPSKNDVGSNTIKRGKSPRRTHDRFRSSAQSLAESSTLVALLTSATVLMTTARHL